VNLLVCLFFWKEIKTKKNLLLLLLLRTTIDHVSRPSFYQAGRGSGGSLPKLASTCMHGLVKVHAVVFDLKHGWPGTLADMHYFQLQQAVLKAWHGHGCSIANDRLQAVCM